MTDTVPVIKEIVEKIAMERKREGGREGEVEEESMHTYIAIISMNSLPSDLFNAVLFLNIILPLPSQLL